MGEIFGEIIRVSAGAGKYRVDGIVIVTRGGLVVCILGGERPHVGAIALAIPRQSLRDQKELSVTSSVLTLIGHKDDEIARPISEAIAKELNQTTVVIAGLHINKASDQDINKLIANSRQVSNKLITKLKELLA